MYVTNLLCFLMLCRKLHSKTKQIKVLLMMPSLHSVLISKTLVIYFTLFFNVFKKFVLLFNATTNLNGYIADICILYTNCYKKREQRKDSLFSYNFLIKLVQFYEVEMLLKFVLLDLLKANIIEQIYMACCKQDIRHLTLHYKPV